MIPRVEDALRVEVGKVYDVPVVGSDLYDDLPVLAETPHADPDLGVLNLHYHLDARFLSVPDMERLASRLRDDFVAEVGLERAAMVVVERWRDWKRVRRVALPCLREMPEFPGEHAPWHGRLAAAHAGKRWSGGCRACPHRGTLLLGVKAVRGVVTCPAHGLRLCARTGEVLG